MAIGPESRRMTSGRIVVIAVGQLLLGAMAIFVGVGPQVRPADAPLRLLGVAAIGLGIVLVIGGAALAARHRRARLLGALGSLAAVLVGMLVVGSAVASIEQCTDGRDDAGPCQTVVGGLGAIGAGVAVAGGAAFVMVRRAPAATLRKSPDR